MPILKIIAGAEDETDTRYADGRHVRLLAMIEKLKLKLSRNNEKMAFADVEDAGGTLEMIIFPKVLAEHAAVVAEHVPLILDGRISLREDEEPKIICERMFPLSQADHLPPAEYGDGRPPRHDEPSPPPAPLPEQQQKRHGNPVLFLRVPSMDSPEWQRALKVMKVFDGITRVFIRCADTGEMVEAPAQYRVMMNDVMLRELSRILGGDNVAVRYARA